MGIKTWLGHSSHTIASIVLVALTAVLAVGCTSPSHAIKPVPSIIGGAVYKEVVNLNCKPEEEYNAALTNGLSGVTVKLFQGGPLPIATAVTDTRGGFVFGPVAPGTYSVSVDTNTDPPGSTPRCSWNAVTNVPSTANPSTVSNIIVDVMEKHEVDFGYNP